MLADDIADYLSSGGIGSVGSTASYGIYKSFLPDAPDKCVVVYETGGAPSVHAMNSAPGHAVVEHPRIQLMIRADEFGYSTGRQKMNDAFLLLDGFRERAINGTTYKWIASVQSPFFITRDQNNRPMLACNFEITKALSTA